MLPSLEEVAEKRKMLDLTQKKLAKLVGVSQSLTAKLESKKIDPSYTKVKAVFDALERLETKTDVHAREDAPLPLISSLLQVYPAVLVSKKGKL